MKLSKKLFLLLFLYCNVSTLQGQDFYSAMGFRAGEGFQWSGKIFLNKKASLNGLVGLVSTKNITPEKSTIAGVHISIAQHFNLFDTDYLHFFTGVGVGGVFGDVEGFGGFAPIGFMYTFSEKFNVELDAQPSYYLEQLLGFKIHYGLTLRFTLGGEV